MFACPLSRTSVHFTDVFVNAVSETKLVRDVDNETDHIVGGTKACAGEFPFHVRITLMRTNRN